MIIDTLCEFYHGDENSTEQAYRFMNGLYSLLDTMFDNIILLHHDAKGMTGQPRGSTVFFDKSRCAWRLEAQGPDRIVAHNTKMNLSARHAPVHLIREGGALRQINIDVDALQTSVLDWMQDNPQSIMTMGGLQQGKGKDASALLNYVTTSHPDADKKQVTEIVKKAVADKLISEVNQKTAKGNKKVLKAV